MHGWIAAVLNLLGMGGGAAAGVAVTPEQSLKVPALNRSLTVPPATRTLAVSPANRSLKVGV